MYLCLDCKLSYLVLANFNNGSCAAQCPVEAIAQGDTQYEIDADACIDCGACEAQCPVGAISEG